MAPEVAPCGKAGAVGEKIADCDVVFQSAGKRRDIAKNRRVEIDLFSLSKVTAEERALA